ncbi:hypothetical protein EGW08_020496, partial [Elysia chlorotica]
LVTIIVITILTNFIVVVVFVTRENRKRSKNIYLANLSLIDLIIGVAVMPVCMLGLLNPNWLLPGAACRVHLVCLHSLAFASLLAVLLVSVDRWYSICYPFTYRVKPTGRIAMYAVILSWTLSFAVHIPLVGAWDLIAAGVRGDSHRVSVGMCHSGGRSGNSNHFINNASQPTVLVFAMVLLKYTAPHVIMLLLKCSLYRKIKQRKTVNVRRSLSSRGSRRYFPNSFGNGGGIDNRRATIGDLAKNLLDKQDSKAAWFLSLLLVVSILCWTPWTLSSLCHQFIVTPAWTQHTALWVLLANSTINPFLYGLINKDFRKVLAFWLRLRGSKKKRLKTALRMLSWQMAWGTMDLGGDADGSRSPG